MAMSDRTQMEKTLRAAYAARKRGDLDTLAGIFAPHARFQMAGSNASPIASKVVGAAEFRPLLAGMIQTFEILDYTIVSMLIDGRRPPCNGTPRCAPASPVRPSRPTCST
jgi:hypothetical protein